MHAIALYVVDIWLHTWKCLPAIGMCVNLSICFFSTPRFMCWWTV